MVLVKMVHGAIVAGSNFFNVGDQRRMRRPPQQPFPTAQARAPGVSSAAKGLRSHLLTSHPVTQPPTQNDTHKALHAPRSHHRARRVLVLRRKRHRA